MTERRVVWPLVAALSVPVVIAALILQWQVLAARAQIAASTRVVGVGIDDDGYWYARVEVRNTGNLPWDAVFVGDAHVIGGTSPAVEVGSTLPHGPIPGRFEFVIETVDEGVVPQDPTTLSFDLGVISEEPWYLASRKVDHWRHELSL